MTKLVRYGQERVLTKVELHNTGRKESKSETPSWLVAVRAAESKKATDIRVLDLTGITSFADYFVICTGANARNVQAIADEVGLQLKHRGELPNCLEGYTQAEWILVDYGDFLVHIFSPKSREYYDLERLWRNARTLEIPAE
ncbi:MAG: ribosome silencing factor [Bryobacteraceae bacterium]|jgi:ribosome-associated protein